MAVPLGIAIFVCGGFLWVLMGSCEVSWIGSALNLISSLSDPLRTYQTPCRINGWFGCVSLTDLIKQLGLFSIAEQP